VHGAVIRYVPEETGCYYCFSKQDKTDIISSPQGEIYPGGCGFPTFTGASHDIYDVATQAVRMACNTMLDRITEDHITIEHYPPALNGYRIQKIADCPYCGGGK
jgi:hypothetical protein